MSNAKPHQKQTICLSMIVKNESKVIRRCLASLKKYITHWVIVDTGSTDGTQAIIKDFMSDIPGELHESPWVNFAHNRNEALELAKSKAEYLLFIDADEILHAEDGFVMPHLHLDFYYVMTHFAATKYCRVQLVKSSLNWKWIGVLHEAIDSPEAKTKELLNGIVNIVSTEGFRSTDPRKYHKDAEVLEKALEEDPTNKRYKFYLAQSYRDAQEYALAIKHYAERVSMGGWDQEVFWAMLQIGILQEELGVSPETIIHSYYSAHCYRPSRIEPIYRLTYWYRRKENYFCGYEIAKKGLAITASDDILFVETWIYDHGLLLEFSICAYWIGRYTEALLASQLLLAKPNLPANIRECVEKNMVWIHTKLAETQPATQFALK